MTGIGHNGIAAEQLRSYVERIERLNVEIADANGAKSEVFKEAKACGFDVPTMRKVIQRRSMDRSDREESDALLELYEGALNGTSRATRVHVHTPAREGDDEQTPAAGAAEADVADADQCASAACPETRTAGGDVSEPFSPAAGTLHDETPSDAEPAAPGSPSGGAAATPVPQASASDPTGAAPDQGDPLPPDSDEAGAAPALSPAAPWIGPSDANPTAPAATPAVSTRAAGEADDEIDYFAIPAFLDRRGERTRP